ncbi:MAG: nucleotidyltransferase domain-containing protein [Deltaproteobacteria bacterium]|nr:nucleotidyltransferase domain-containing protein [Deltaproteobacteria bacterium]
MIDLPPHHLTTVRRILADTIPGYEVRVFGSRVTGTAKPHSDLDLAVVADHPLDLKTLSRLREAFEESDLPIRVDLVEWNSISDEFRKVIEESYEIILEGENSSPGP